MLDKDPAATFVVIDEVEMEDWGVGGPPVHEYRRRQSGPSAGSSGEGAG
ncbi:tautomerase family protein [Dactylosporangium sp. AC04546]|nr:tautomerase family protein [Dactylosporangium sp. AC04546]WVK87352.1 tautomerase family protein [Dactylosporangium sp. AC04546]